MSGGCYPHTVNWRAFALFLEARRVHRGVRMRQIARATGLDPTVVLRATGRGRGGWLKRAQFEALCAWMGENPETFDHAAPRRPPQPSPLASPGRRRDDGQRGAGGSCPAGIPAPAASTAPPSGSTGGPAPDHRPRGA